MKPYGIKNVHTFPDVADIHAQGRKSSVGHNSCRGRKAKSYFRNSESKRAIRRRFKRKARKQAKKECEE